MKVKKTLFLGLDIYNSKTPRNLVIAVLSIWALSALVISFWSDLPKQGQIGDMFGAVNALFSGLAFAGIIYTILLQREELNEQRRELRLTRKEFRQQNETLSLQRFEDTFFKLLQFQNDLVNQIRYTNQSEGITYIGKGGFAMFYRILSHMVTQTNNNFDQVVYQYDLLFTKYEEHLGHYYGNLFQILSLIDASQEVRDKGKYINILRAQFTTYELLFLYYHGLSFHGITYYKPLIERYKLLHKCNVNLLLAGDKYNYQSNAFLE